MGDRQKWKEWKAIAAKLWLFARYPVIVVVAAADMADYSGKSGNFMFAQIAIARIAGRI